MIGACGVIPASLVGTTALSAAPGSAADKSRLQPDEKLSENDEEGVWHSTGF